ncbi:pre-mRNA-splicing factor 38A [Zeugodacus cucurbitae]|uniref:pre-mRNA-splicing factor 38A n=1 Tax=Zeugodacus cucurbitae TaxID=28588 RepID=UPI0023D8F622|nr:pre-mRNA-splicing factor 38A [Zeugodacus cucurbitae]
MRIAKLHLLPALLLIATVKLDIVATEKWSPIQMLQASTTPCPPIVTYTEIVVKDPTPAPSTGSTGPGDDGLGDTDYDPDYTGPAGDYTLRSIEPDYDSLPVNSIGRNAELNTINGTDSARKQQTIVIRQGSPARRGSQRRRRRPNRRRPSAEKRRRRNRHNSKDRRRRRRRGQRKGQRKGSRQELRQEPRQASPRVFLRRHYTNRRKLGESTAKNEQPQ